MSERPHPDRAALFQGEMALLEHLEAIVAQWSRPAGELQVWIDGARCSSRADGTWELPEGACELEIRDERSIPRLIVADLLEAGVGDRTRNGVHAMWAERRLVVSAVGAERLAASHKPPWAGAFDVISGPELDPHTGDFVLELQFDATDTGRLVCVDFVGGNLSSLEVRIKASGRATFRGPRDVPPERLNDIQVRFADSV
ncbi:MAG: hypothetical protein KTR31_17445 [Myxococcales bacterium]|nr:hypothetical protein [Myxococcales bacterium]